MSSHILAIDQGTTSSRAIVFDDKAMLCSSHQIEFKQHFPKDAWVEHDANEIWKTTLACCLNALEKANLTSKDIKAIGITNQRETTILWDKNTGEPVYNAIVWQDRRTHGHCQKLKSDGLEENIKNKTGLVLDPYFSATKIQWILDNVDSVRQKAERGDILFGTVDSFLLWRLTEGQVHATDATNASRTLLYNIHEQCWDDELLKVFNIPREILPKVLNSSDDFGSTTILGSPIPITGIAGDQQAATFGQACFKSGMAKSTYGTGTFIVLNTGDKAIASKNKLLTTIAYQLDGKATYALECSIFSTGSCIQWLRDGLGIIKQARETEAMARSVESNGGVYMVPAFTGLGAPYWDANVRGAILGLTRDSSSAHIVRAALESVCFQTRDLIEALQADMQSELTELRVDGGMIINKWLMQFLADMLGLPVVRACIVETSALGVSFLAGLYSGIFDSLEHVTALHQSDYTFQASIDEKDRANLYHNWQRAIDKARHER